MRKYLLTFVTLFLVPTLTYAASPADKARAALALAAATHRQPAAPTPDPFSAANCQCGCVTTGKCNCPDCNHPAKGSATKPACACGCEQTGKCICPNCDTHKEAPKPKLPALPTWGPPQDGRRWEPIAPSEKYPEGAWRQSDAQSVPFSSAPVTMQGQAVMQQQTGGTVCRT
jgi:hypothetical protein